MDPKIFGSQKIFGPILGKTSPPYARVAVITNKQPQNTFETLMKIFRSTDETPLKHWRNTSEKLVRHW